MRKTRILRWRRDKEKQSAWVAAAPSARERARRKALLPADTQDLYAEGEFEYVDDEEELEEWQRGGAIADEQEMEGSPALGPAETGTDDERAPTPPPPSASCSAAGRARSPELPSPEKRPRTTAGHDAPAARRVHTRKAATPSAESVSGEDPGPPGSRTDAALGSGGCTAHALAKLGVFGSAAQAMAALDEQMAKTAAKLRGDQRGPTYVGVAGDRWHPKVVGDTVVGLPQGFHYRKVDLANEALPALLLGKRGDRLVQGYLLDGVLNDTFVKRNARGVEERFDTDPDDPTTPRANEAGWRHCVAVRKGRILEKEFDMEAQWLWLDEGGVPDASRGYLYKLLRVCEIARCSAPGTGCRGECRRAA